MSVKNDVKKWRKQSLKSLKILEANMWFMISEFGQAAYTPKHSALRRFIANYEAVRRNPSEKLQLLGKLIRGRNQAVKENNQAAFNNYTKLLQIGVFLSNKWEMVD